MNRIVSLYENMTSTQANHIELSRVLYHIKNGWWKDKVEQLPKDQLPCFTVSGTFRGAKKQENLDQKSLVISLDLDDIENWVEVAFLLDTKIKNHIYSHFTSVSGKGCCILVAIDDFTDIEDYKQIYEALYHELIGLNEFCKFDYLNNLNRLRYVSYDPDLYLNEEAVPYDKRRELPINIPVKKDGVLSNVSLDMNKLVGIDRINKIVETYTLHTGHFGANGKPRHDWVLGLTRWLCRGDVSESDAFDYICQNFHNPERASVWTKEVSRCVRDSYNAYAAERGSYVPQKSFDYRVSPNNIEEAKSLFLQYVSIEEENMNKIGDAKLRDFVSNKIEFLKTIYKWL